MRHIAAMALAGLTLASAASAQTPQGFLAGGKPPPAPLSLNSPLVYDTATYSVGQTSVTVIPSTAATNTPLRYLEIDRIGSTAANAGYTVWCTPLTASVTSATVGQGIPLFIGSSLPQIVRSYPAIATNGWACIGSNPTAEPITVVVGF